MDRKAPEFSPLGLEQRKLLADRYGLGEEEFTKLLDDLWLLTGETVEGFARRRHGELQADGIGNDLGFSIIGQEIQAGRFAPPTLSLRQIRRIIYG